MTPNESTATTQGETSSRERAGELIAGSAAALWGLFPVITVLTVSSLTPLYSVALGTGISAVFFAVILTLRKGWRMPPVGIWRDILLATLILGIIYYGLTFVAYQFTTAGNGAIVGLSEVFFTFIIVNLLWRHEPFIPKHAVGGACTVLGALIVVAPAGTGWNAGDLLIAGAGIILPIGNVFAQRARRVVSSEMLLFVRSSLSAVALFALAAMMEPAPGSGALQDSVWLLLINGIALLGLQKILWVEALHRMPVAKTVALTTIEPLLTLGFAYAILGDIPTWQQLLGVAPMIAGVYLLTSRIARPKNSDHSSASVENLK